MWIIYGNTFYEEIIMSLSPFWSCFLQIKAPEQLHLAVFLNTDKNDNDKNPLSNMFTY